MNAENPSLPAQIKVENATSQVTTAMLICPPVNNIRAPSSLKHMQALSLAEAKTRQGIQASDDSKKTKYNIARRSVMPCRLLISFPIPRTHHRPRQVLELLPARVRLSPVQQA